jgi:hypothetical protein
MDDQDYHDGTSEYLDFSADLRKGKAKVMFGDVGELEASLKKIKGQATVGDIKLNGEYKYNGEWKAKASTPILGNGVAEGEINSAGDWQVKAAKPMFGGQLSLDANGNGGQKRYYIQYTKTF